MAPSLNIISTLSCEDILANDLRYTPLSSPLWAGPQGMAVTVSEQGSYTLIFTEALLRS